MPLPTVGDKPGVSLQTTIESTERVNGKGALCIKLDGAALNHLTYMAHEFFVTHGLDADSNEDDSGTAESEQEDDDIHGGEVEIDGAGFDNDQLHEHDDGMDMGAENASNDHAHMNAENSTNDHAPAEAAASSEPTRQHSHLETPILDALVRGSKASSA